ncbi:hypothetical protein DFH09DRAFT_308466 [Mycena vulgaris]|nr:hypothetical protein DFH09DRAFT_308466 [Mycena vulgaris]
MLASKSLVLASLIAVASAHFQLAFPAPRGVFVEDDEPTFCDGYDNEATNRTVFPLSGGFFTLNSEHTTWTAGVALATKPNSTSFDDFKPVVPFFQLTGEGVFCIPLDFSKTNATGLTDGQNVTVEITFNGGDGPLYQCADLTLSSTAKIASTVTCSNATSTTSGASPSSTAPSGYLGLLLGLVGVAAVFV